MWKTKSLEEQITAVLEDNKFCSFGTIDGQKPKVRYMALFNEGLTLYLATNAKTDKVDEILGNPNVYVLVGFDGKKSNDILQIEAKAEVCKDETLRERLWNSSFKEWFEGPHDPEYVILKINPDRIEYTGADKEPQVWEK
ncbi:General stress protein 26 [Paenibacillus sp. UNCCL117]|uniref:pyridoxamine 5'-phosphate oxidase family protein n=1 Tax=unclassified Paenibacillus TaxID=185978 RepID=UPI00089167EE|nr:MULTISPECIES: pyridoxamine 5'-phosphate oxidase family protein [unclassified Paenibacillus]SDD92133.1 General stress protein 26 [Paenibacillus sp. cl123]SFW43551.1 General stress protein 26 [Paenibacillus sp. UNCCL117]